jgi:hypothetical protein
VTRTDDKRSRDRVVARGVQGRGRSKSLRAAAGTHRRQVPQAARLSERRANAVRSYLIGKGIDPARLEAKGYGESQPLAKGQSDKAMGENRRVEFVITDSAEGE